jgi:tRNA pseudouridine32 synthase/23S rRNA pseudouridine746 synthase
LERSGSFDLLKRCEEKKPSKLLPTDASFSPEGGQMLGVLIAEAEEGRKHTLHAYSGNLGGRSTRPGWVPPIAFGDQKPEWLLKGEEALRLESAELEVRQHCLLREDRRRQSEVDEVERRFAIDLEAHLSGVRERRTARAIRREKLLLQPAHERAGARRRLDDESSEDSRRERELRMRTREALGGISLERARLGADVRERTEARAERSRALQVKVFEAYRLMNLAGRSAGLLEVFLGSRLPPTGTGDCCAPKLIQAAAKMGLHPTGLVEFWWGDSPSRGHRSHGQVYEACSKKCVPILGYMLCRASAS